MKKILFVTYGGGHANIVGSIYKYFKSNCVNKHQEIEATILALSTAISYFKNNNIEYNTLQGYIDDFPQKEEILKIGRELAPRYHNYELKELDFKETVAYYGFGMYDLQKNKGWDTANKIFKKEGRKAFLPISTMEKILLVEDPDIVVISCAVRYELATVLAAKKLNIPTVRIYDLFICYDHVDVDYYFVLNQFQKNYLIQNNINKSHIYVVGQPDFDQLFNYKIKSKDEIYSELKIDINRKNILWASGPLKDALSNTNLLMKVFAVRPDWQLIIKIHPNEETRPYEKLIKQYGLSNVIVVKTYNLVKLIHISDLLVTQVSTVGFQGLLYEKNLLVLNLFNNQYSLKYADYGLAIEVKNFEHLENAIESLLDYSSKESIMIKENIKKFKVPHNACQVTCEALFDILKLE